MYYALTKKGYDRVERGLPEHKSDYFSVLGALADLEETEPLKPHMPHQIRRAMEKPRSYSLYLTLKSLTKNGLIEEIPIGDERFPDFK